MADTIGLAFFFTGLSIVGFIFLIAVYRWFFRSRDQVVETRAYVVENEIRSSDNSFLYHPVIQFDTEDGERHQYTSNVRTAPPRVRKGTYVTLYYLRSNPRKYQIKAGVVVYVLTTLFAICGLIFSSVGMWMILGNIDKT